MLRRFADIDLGRAPSPDETAIFNFRHLQHEQDLGESMLDVANLYLARNGICITTRTIVDATIVYASPSTKNENKECDSKLHQARKGNQWYFGAKPHLGVDSRKGVVHSVCTSAAGVSDVHMLPDLLHNAEKEVWSDVGYQGQPAAQKMTNCRVKTKSGVNEEQKLKFRPRARVRAMVERSFRALKRASGAMRLCYRELNKNHEWLCAAFASVNVYQRAVTDLSISGLLNEYYGPATGNPLSHRGFVD